jgi:hypothetical protein
MTRRIFIGLIGQSDKLNWRSRWNYGLNAMVAGSFLLTAVSGVYFLFAPGGRGAVDPFFIVQRATWDMIHTWSGVVLVTAAVIHFAIHWRWVLRVTVKVFTLISYQFTQLRRKQTSAEF